MADGGVHIRGHSGWGCLLGWLSGAGPRSYSGRTDGIVVFDHHVGELRKFVGVMTISERFPQRSPSRDVSPDLQSGIFALEARLPKSEGRGHPCKSGRSRRARVPVAARDGDQTCSTWLDTCVAIALVSFDLRAVFRTRHVKFSCWQRSLLAAGVP